MVTILKLNVSNNLKAAAVRLLMCLHVDRDPQASSRIPCLTRCWSDIDKHETPHLPCVEPGRKFMFGIIQHCISVHIAEMACARWDEFSRHMLKMLRTLIEFNFYGSNERIQNLIGPLIKALDRRTLITKSRASKSAVPPAPADNVSLLGDSSAHSLHEAEEGDNEVLDEDSSNQSFWGRLINSIGQGLRVKRYAPIVPEAQEVVLGEESSTTVKRSAYQVPSRYSKAPIYELETMVEAVDILAFAQKVIEDRNMSLLMRAFYDWHSGKDSSSPSDLFNKVIEDAKELTVDVNGFSTIMVDILMYEHTPLVQSTLEVLMAHYSSKHSLLENVKNSQLLASNGRERQFRLVDQMLKQLEQNAETHELWGELESEADQAQNKQTKDILKELTDICR
ncbi:hypothetical protein EON65_58320, partial [archaeon]